MASSWVMFPTDLGVRVLVLLAILILPPGIRKRVENPGAQTPDVRDVSGHQCQVVHDRGCSQQTIHNGDVTNVVRSPPCLRSHFIDGQYTPGESQNNLIEPAFQNDGLLRIAPTYPLDASAHLTKHQYTEEDVGFLHS